MKAVNLDTDNAGFYAFAAARDARMRAAAMWSHYTSTQRTRAERMKLGLEMVYAAKSAFITYRKKFVTIKLDQARVCDRKTLAQFEKDYTSQGDVTKVVTTQGITYRIARG